MGAQLQIAISDSLMLGYGLDLTYRLHYILQVLSLLYQQQVL